MFADEYVSWIAHFVEHPVSKAQHLSKGIEPAV